MMSTTKLIEVLRKFPKEIFRVNNGSQVKLRIWTPERRVYDISTTNGLVQPKAMKPMSYEGESCKASFVQRNIKSELISS